MGDYWRKWLLVGFVSLGLINCAGEDEQDEAVQGEEGYDEQGEDYQQEGDQQNADQQNGNQQGDYQEGGNEAGGNNYGEEGNTQNGYANEGGNAQAGNNQLEGQAQGEQLNNSLGNDTQQQGYANQDAMPQEGEGMNNATGNEYANDGGGAMDEQPAVDAGADQAAMAAVAPVAAPMPGGKVMYVSSNATLYSSPGGAPAGSIERGGHPLIWTSASVAQAGVAPGNQQIGQMQPDAQGGEDMPDVQSTPANGGYEQVEQYQEAGASGGNSGGNYSY